MVHLRSLRCFHALGETRGIRDSDPRLFRKFHAAGLAHHGNPDLAWILQVVLDFSRDVPCQSVRVFIAQRLRLHHHPQLPPRLDSIALLNACTRRPFRADDRLSHRDAPSPKGAQDGARRPRCAEGLEPYRGAHALRLYPSRSDDGSRNRRSRADQSVCKPHDILIELIIGHDPFTTTLSSPEDGYFISPVIIDMALKAVVCDIQLRFCEPLCERMFPHFHFVPGLKPEEIRSDAPPECIRISHELLIFLIIIRDQHRFLVRRIRVKNFIVFPGFILIF